jgi:hypothetical protein
VRNVSKKDVALDYKSQTLVILMPVKDGHNYKDQGVQHVSRSVQVRTPVSITSMFIYQNLREDISCLCHRSGC